MITHCDADAAEAAVLRPCWLRQPAGAAIFTWREQNMIIRIFVHPRMMTDRHDIVTLKRSTEPREEIRQGKQYWYGYDELRWKVRHGVDEEEDGTSSDQ